MIPDASGTPRSAPLDGAQKDKAGARSVLWIAAPPGTDSAPAVALLKRCGISTRTIGLPGISTQTSGLASGTFLEEFAVLLHLYFGADSISPQPLDFGSLPTAIRSKLDESALRGWGGAPPKHPLAIFDAWSPFTFEFWLPLLDRSAVLFWLESSAVVTNDHSGQKENSANEVWRSYWNAALHRVSPEYRIPIDASDARTSTDEIVMKLASTLQQRGFIVDLPDGGNSGTIDKTSPEEQGAGGGSLAGISSNLYQAVLSGDTSAREFLGGAADLAELSYNPEALIHSLPALLDSESGAHGLLGRGSSPMMVSNRATDIRFEEYRNEVKELLSREREELALSKRRLRRLAEKLRLREAELKRESRRQSRSGRLSVQGISSLLTRWAGGTGESDPANEEPQPKSEVSAEPESDELERALKEIEAVSIYGASKRLHLLIHGEGVFGRLQYVLLSYLRSHTGEPPLYPEPSEEELRFAPEFQNVDLWYRQKRALRVRPVISILIPIHATPPEILNATFQSVLDQVYEHWEVCLAVDGATEEETDEVVTRFEQHGADRVRCVHLDDVPGISGSSNAAAALATGEYIGLLDHDDLLTPNALLEVAMAINGEPEADLIYSDEDKVTFDGGLGHEFWKPDYSPELLESFNYITHFTVIRRSVFQEIGGFRRGFEGSQDHDLVLRAAERSRRVVHIPEVLYHWRMIAGSTSADFEAKGDMCRAASIRALEDSIHRRGEKATVESGRAVCTYRVRYAVNPESRVNILIPTKDNVELLRQCVESVRTLSTHRAYEIVVIANNSERPETTTFLEEASRRGDLRYLRHDIPFNYSALNNFAVRETDAPYLLLLNDDTQVISPGWLEAMLEHAQRKPIGAVGARLLFEDRTIQHAGLFLGGGGIAGHAFKGNPVEGDEYYNYLNVVRNCAAVTGACLMVRREVYDEVGGMDEKMACAFNDVDFCLRVLKAGYRIVYTPYAELFHYESKTRGYPDNAAKRKLFDDEIAYTYRKWGEELYRDPYYNPNQTLIREDFSRKTLEDREGEILFRLLGEIDRLAT